MPKLNDIMRAKPIIFGALLSLGVNAGAQSAARDGDTLKFMGREVTITEPERDTDGFFPKGPASVCLEGPPQRRCYTAPSDFGNEPSVAVVQLEDMPALLFSAAGGGVSGWAIYFALLRPGTGKNLQNLFLSGISISNQSQHAFWTDTAVSAAPIFVTADYVWGPDECHYSEHRYIISAYVRKPSSLLDDRYYYLEDRYMTVQKIRPGRGGGHFGFRKARDPRPVPAAESRRRASGSRTALRQCVAGIRFYGTVMTIFPICWLDSRYR
jgi:hypothetical protein